MSQVETESFTGVVAGRTTTARPESPASSLSDNVGTDASRAAGDSGPGRVLGFERALVRRLLARVGNPPVRVILWNGGKVAEAKKQFEAAIAANPGHAEAHYQLGMALVNDSWRFVTGWVKPSSAACSACR